MDGKVAQMRERRVGSGRSLYQQPTTQCIPYLRFDTCCTSYCTFLSIVCVSAPRYSPKNDSVLRYISWVQFWYGGRFVIEVQYPALTRPTTITPQYWTDV